MMNRFVFFAVCAFACAATSFGKRAVDPAEDELLRRIALPMPYSVDGAYLTIDAYCSDGGKRHENPGVWIKTVSDRYRRQFISKLIPVVGGKEIGFARLVDENPSVLKLVTEAGEIEATFARSDTLLLRSKVKGMGLVLEFDGSGVEKVPCDGAKAFFRGDCYLNAGFAVRKGAAESFPKGEPHARLVVSPEDGGFEVAVVDNVGGWDGIVVQTPFDEAVAANAAAFSSFLKKIPSVGKEFEAARLKAAKVLWMCQVEPRGLIQRHAMMMSKNWMNHIWSWDHVFNAMAISYGDDDGQDALDQFLCMFDSQSANGSLPDRLGDGSYLQEKLKPPVHGWGLMRMLRSRRFTDAQVSEVYGPLKKWTEFWFKHRDRDRNGLCEYDDGCDSGWDNSTAFLVATPIETPELQAYLVLQMEALAEVADRLGRGAEAAEWRKKADALAERAIATLFDKDGSPRARQVFTGEFSKPQTMLTRLGLMFGKRLPERTRAKIVSEMMSDDFLTPYGLATESVKSPNYKPDGYWLGPIWGPEMMISYDALRRAGYEKEARDVALRFCRLCAKSGFAENFDALTGAPRRDPAYTWTAAAFLVMAHELGETAD